MCFVAIILSASAFLSFFFNDTATTEIYTLSLHDALPILLTAWHSVRPQVEGFLGSYPKALLCPLSHTAPPTWGDRKSTRLNSSHGYISYAVFCLKKKTQELEVYILHKSRAGIARDRR